MAARAVRVALRLSGFVDVVMTGPGASRIALIAMWRPLPEPGTGYVHSVTATAASVHDLDQITHLVRADDDVVYADAGYQGAGKRPDFADDRHLSQVEFRIAARKSKLAAMAQPDRVAESRKASVRAKVEHPFLIVKRDFGFTKTRYRGMAKNLNHFNVLFASANWVMRARAVAMMG